MYKKKNRVAVHIWKNNQYLRYKFIIISCGHMV
jgi:hypothetical protein